MAGYEEEAEGKGRRSCENGWAGGRESGGGWEKGGSRESGDDGLSWQFQWACFLWEYSGADKRVDAHPLGILVVQDW